VTKLFRKILVPFDFSAPATHALQVAADLAAEHRGTIEVLHVLPPFYSGVGFPTQAEIAWTPPPEMIRDLRTRLTQDVAKALGRRKGIATCRALLGDPVQSILSAARRADVIVMATLGRTGLAHLVMGSIAERVVRHSPVPVLTVRPTAARRRTSRTRTRGR
jgi:nucleotide-binding universal stress UspA family protein